MSKKLFGIIGKPISHSLSPVLHNYWFEKYNIKANYVLLDADEENIETIIKKIRNKELSGINVTLPGVTKSRGPPTSEAGPKDCSRFTEALTSCVDTVPSPVAPNAS